jgi:hypothetical protein
MQRRPHMVGAVHDNSSGSVKRTAAIGLHDPSLSPDVARPGAIFRIAPDGQWRWLAQLPVDWRTDTAARRHHVPAELSAIAQCVGLWSVPGTGEVSGTLPVTIEVMATETAIGLEDAVWTVADRIDLDGPGRCIVIVTCLLVRDLSVVLPRDTGNVTLRLSLDQPRRLMLGIAELQRTAGGVTLLPVREVLSWLREPAEMPRPAAGAPRGLEGASRGLEAASRGLECAPRGLEETVRAGLAFEAADLDLGESAAPGAQAAPRAKATPCDGAADHAAAGAEPSVDATPAPDDEVQWHTRLCDGDRAVKALTVGRTFALETWLGREVDPGSLGASIAIARDLVPDGTAVTFVIACSAPVLRPAGSAAAVARYTETVALTAGATPRVKVPIVPEEIGELAIVISLQTDRALRLRSRFVVPVAASAPSLAAPVAAPPAPGTPVALRALVGRPAAIRLEVDRSGQLEVDVGALHWGPGAIAHELDALAGTAVEVRRELVNRAEAYRQRLAAGPFGLEDAGKTMLEFAKQGARLHEAFFGRHGDTHVDLRLQQVAELIARCPGGRMQIVAGSVPFPWEVVYDARYLDRSKPLATAADVDPNGFWGARFQIDRAVDAHLDGSWPPPPGAPVRAQLCLNPQLDPAVVTKEESIFVRRRAPVEPLHAIRSNGELCAFVHDPPAGGVDLLYLFCHAHAAETVTVTSFKPQLAAETHAWLTLDGSDAADSPLHVSELLDASCKPLPGQPLVVFNACGSAAGDRAFQSAFLTLFVDTYRARGFIGTDWSVNQVFADAFGRRLIELLLDERLAVADALARVRAEALSAGNPFAFSYALYACPDLTLFPGAKP